MKKCPECGKELASNARNCPGCGKRFAHPFVKFIGLCFVGFILLIVIGSISEHSESNYTQPASTAIASPTNDADLLVSRCGKPDIDDSTAYDNPRPPIPTRMITYTKAHLMFAYYPGGGATPTDDPPYQWKLLGLTDTRTRKAITAAQLKDILTHRLPCALGK